MEKFGNPHQKAALLRGLNEVDHRLPLVGDTAGETINRVHKLFSRAAVIDISDAIKLRAAQRAIDKRAPFHRQRKASMMQS